MIVDPAVIPGLLILAAELAALAAVGYVVVRVALRQSDDRVALAQGLVVGPALWGLITNFVLYAVPGLAGAAVGWGVTLALGAVLARRSPQPLRPRLGTAVGFAGAFLVLLWLALASRQLLEMPDPTLHLGLAAWIRAGGFPPEVPWNPGHLVRYHHGVDLLVGLLTPPVGPDLAFVQELLGAYAWTAFALVVVTALLGRGSWKVSLVIAPLLLTAGAWTWTSLGGGILQLAVPSGLPAADVGAALASFYWPPLGPSWPSEPAALHDVWTPAFTLGYALTFVVLERAARSEGLSWPSVLVLAGIVGFVGILVTSLVPVLIVLWAALAAVHVVQNRRGRAVGAARRWGAGLGLAAVLLLFGGGAFTAFLDGGPSTSLALTWDLNRTHWEALGTFDAPLGRCRRAGSRTLGHSRLRRAIGTARSSGADAGSGRRPAGAGLAGSQLSDGAVGAQSLGGTCPQSGAGGAAARAHWRLFRTTCETPSSFPRRRESSPRRTRSRAGFDHGVLRSTVPGRRPPLRFVPGSLAIFFGRSARWTDRLANYCGARAQSRACRRQRRPAG